MGALDSIGEFATGLNQGVGRGMDLYSQYQQIEEQGAKRQKTKLMEDYISNLAKEGGFKDQAGAMDKLAQYAAEIGDYENYDKFYQQGVGLRKAKTFNEGAKFVSVLNAASDPSSAIPILNNYYKMLGINTQYDIKPGLNGEFELISNTDGKVSSEKFTDPIAAKYKLMSTVEPFMFDSPGDYLENEREDMKAQAAAGKDRAASMLDTVKAELEPSKVAADIKQSEASAASSFASANKANIEARLAPDVAASTIGANTARAGLYNTSSDANISSVVDDSYGDELPPDPSMPVPPSQDRALVKGLTSALASANGIDANQAVAISKSVLSGDQDFYFNDKTGEMVYNGEPLKLPKALAETIAEALEKYDTSRLGNP